MDKANNQGGNESLTYTAPKQPKKKGRFWCGYAFSEYICKIEDLKEYVLFGREESSLIFIRFFFSHYWKYSFMNICMCTPLWHTHTEPAQTFDVCFSASMIFHCFLFKDIVMHLVLLWISCDRKKVSVFDFLKIDPYCKSDGGADGSPAATAVKFATVVQAYKLYVSFFPTFKLCKCVFILLIFKW